MDLLSHRLRPISTAHAARAIGRFLERESAPPAAGGEGAAVGEDVRGQLEAMRAALLRVEKGGGKSGSVRKSSGATAAAAEEAEEEEGGGGGGGGGAGAGGGGTRKQKKRREG